MTHHLGNLGKIVWRITKTKDIARYPRLCTTVDDFMKYISAYFMTFRETCTPPLYTMGFCADSLTDHPGMVMPFNVVVTLMCDLFTATSAF